MNTSTAGIVREYGPLSGIDSVHGVTYDGRNIWFASGNQLNVLDPDSGKTLRSLAITANAGTAFDGKHIFQIADRRIQKIDPQDGHIVGTIPTPRGEDSSGLAWADGTLWVGRHKERIIDQIDPETGAILRSLESNRYVTGVTWIKGELWHGTWEDDASELRRIDPVSGKVLETLEMPPGVHVSGLESDGGEHFFCGDGNGRTVRMVSRS